MKMRLAGRVGACRSPDAIGWQHSRCMPQSPSVDAAKLGEPRNYDHPRRCSLYQRRSQGERPVPMSFAGGPAGCRAHEDSPFKHIAATCSALCRYGSQISGWPQYTSPPFPHAVLDVTSTATDVAWTPDAAVTPFVLLRGGTCFQQQKPARAMAIRTTVPPRASNSL